MSEKLKPATKQPDQSDIFDEDIKRAMGGVLTEEQQKLMNELDRESATRKMESPLVSRLFYFSCIAVTLYHFITAIDWTPLVLEHRSLHVAMMLALGFMMYPFNKKSRDARVHWSDWVLIALSLAVPLYVWTNYLGVVERAGNPNMTDMLIVTLLVVLVLEGSRRMTGWALPILSLIFIVYGLFGRELPGLFGHRGYTWMQLSNHFFANTEGIYGTSVSVAASYIFLFILFGCVMSKSGMGMFFNDLAMALAGHTKGGPAKVAVISSGLISSVNGSAIANVMTTGPFTIPLMKKTGYSKEFAGAVEASASVGGQLTPPVMGAAAFIMAEIIGMPYSQILIHATIPALLYYLGVIIQVQLRASKTGLLGLPKDRLPIVKDVLKSKGHLLIPIFILFYLLFFSGMTVIMAAVITITATIPTAALRKETRMSFKDVCDAFADGAKQTVPVAMACACVGIIVGTISKTGFGLTMANAIISMGHESLLFTLIFSMLACMVLGLGVPSIPAYIITATIAAPALAKLGIPPIAAHLFAFYYAMFANITPPVALVAFAAAGLSGGDPMKTGIAAMKLALAGFIVPFMFVFSPQLILIDTTFLEAVYVVIGACMGVFLLSTAVEGYMFTKLNSLLRIVAFAGALGLIHINVFTDVIGFAILSFLVATQYYLMKKEQAAVKI